QVRDVADSPAPDDEAQRVLDVFPDLGTRTQVDQVLPDVGMAIGDERDELAGAILHVIHPRSWTLERGSALLSRVEKGATGRDDAVFLVAIKAVSQNGVWMDVKGDARVRLDDARLVSIGLAGTYSYQKEAEAGSFSLQRTVEDL